MGFGGAALVHGNEENRMEGIKTVFRGGLWIVHRNDYLFRGTDHDFLITLVGGKFHLKRM